MNLWIGLSALQSSQFAINNVSHNLANASTEGFHRQEVGLQTRMPQYISGNFVGSGVEVAGVRRIREQIIESAFTNSIADLSGIEQRLAIEMRIESAFLPGQGSIQNSLTGMFDEFARLSANPGDTTLRNSVVNQGVNLAQRIQHLSAELVELKHSVGRQLELEVNALNQDIETLVDLQNRIRSSGLHVVSNDMLDQRDQLINSIAERIDVQRYETVQEGLGLAIAGSSISIGLAPVRFETVTREDGTMAIHVEGADRETKFVSGKLAVLTDLHNNLIDQYTDTIDQFAGELIRQVDQAHAVGVGLGGPYSVLRGIRSVVDVNASLNESGIAFPVESGELFISVTSPDNQRRTASISIDPGTDSLNDIAAKISGIDNVQALVDVNTGQLSIIAAPGYRFDFTGDLETTPDLTNFSGTSVPLIDGNYEGASNRQYIVRTVGTGTVGKSPNLKARLTDLDGNVIKEFDIGEGYEAGSKLDLGDGVVIGFAVGDVVDGDSFEANMVASSDTSGILSSLGLNSFFQGSDATDIAVSSRLTENADAFATSRSGDIGDTRNLAGLIAVRQQPFLGDGRFTFDDFLAETNAEIGFRVQSTKSVQANVAELHFQYRTERDSASGVDINEELVYLTQYQKSYEAAVQVVRTMESMLDELFQIIR